MTTVDPEGATPPEDPEELRQELDEARETLRAIRSGAFDALVIDTGSGDELFTLSGTERPHRLVEVVAEGALGYSGRWRSITTARSPTARSRPTP